VTDTLVWRWEKEKCDFSATRMDRQNVHCHGSTQTVSNERGTWHFSIVQIFEILLRDPLIITNRFLFHTRRLSPLNLRWLNSFSSDSVWGILPTDNVRLSRIQPSNNITRGSIFLLLRILSVVFDIVHWELRVVEFWNFQADEIVVRIVLELRLVEFNVSPNNHFPPVNIPESIPLGILLVSQKNAIHHSLAEFAKFSLIQ
jgi:hypothetical protein